MPRKEVEMEPEVAKAYIPEPEYQEYTTKDVITYALGVGANVKDDLDYLYEGAENFMPLPTYVVSPGLIAAQVVGWPGIDADVSRILHGEQYIEVYEPLPAEANIKSQARVIDVLDKGSGALIVSEVTSFDVQTGKKIAVQHFSTFQVGSGNFGGQRTSENEKLAADIPSRAPDAVIEEKTSFEQAALYRLGSGDYNPLHIDPQFSKKAGFKDPILHGLCSLGFASRHVIKAWADNDATRFKSMKVRFSSPVIPGQTLRTEMWKDGNRVVFQVKVKETGKVVLANSWLELSHVNAKPMVTERYAAKL